jgi:hypothetical protein
VHIIYIMQGFAMNIYFKSAMNHFYEVPIQDKKSETLEHVTSCLQHQGINGEVRFVFSGRLLKTDEDLRKALQEGGEKDDPIMIIARSVTSGHGRNSCQNGESKEIRSRKRT